MAPDNSVEHSIGVLAGNLLAARPLIDVLEQPIRLTPNGPFIHELYEDGRLEVQRLLDRISTSACLPRFKLCRFLHSSDMTVFEQVVSAAIDVNEEMLRKAASVSDREADSMTKSAIEASFNQKYGGGTASSFDGLPLNVYAAGSRNPQAVVMIPACGMPAKLYERWITFLAAQYFVVTWESRGLFGSSALPGEDGFGI